MKRFANSKALEILKEDFFWEESDEFAPFGSDESYDAFFALKQWIEYNSNTKIEYYFLSRLKNSEVNVIEFEEINSMNLIIIEEIDWEIIAICFGQLILTGNIDDKIRMFAKIAIKRQLKKSVLDYIVDSKPLQDSRRKILEKELEVLNSI